MRESASHPTTRTPRVSGTPASPLGLQIAYATLTLVGELSFYFCMKEVGKKGRAVVTTAALLKSFCELGKRNVALSGVTAELRVYMRSGVS